MVARRPLLPGPEHAGTGRWPPLRVFLSHTSELRTHPRSRSFVAAAEEAVKRSEHALIDMAYFPASAASPADLCCAKIATADVFVAIIGFRYGSPVAHRPELSYTELEFETASRLRLARLIFLLREDAASLPPVTQSIEDSARQREFRHRLLDAGVTVASIASPAELELKLFHALSDMRR